MGFVDLVQFFISIGVCIFAGFIGSLFTASAIPTWYAELNLPPFNPPDWVFGPVWTVLYILMGIALFAVWRQGTEDSEVKGGMILFGLQLALNVLWSIVFFGMHSILGGVIVIILLWLLLLFVTGSFFQVSELAGWLLVPYIAWVSFAAVLNVAILVLN